MYLVYLSEVLKRAFTATPRMTDALQVLTASALPAISTLFGLQLPTDASTLVLAYIGLAALAYFVIRFFWAPYAIWKEDKAAIADLKLELTKPERLVMQHLAKKKARYRSKLIKELQNIYDAGFQYNAKIAYEGNRHFNKACHLLAVSGLDVRLNNPIIVLQEASTFRFENKLEGQWTTDLRCLYSIFDYLNDRTTIEDLLTRWPRGTALKIQP